MNINTLNDYLLDVLKEIGNIGSGNATTALALMINKKIDMRVPKVRILNFSDVTEVLGNAEAPVVGIYFEMNGDVVGNILFILSVDSARNLVSMLTNNKQNHDNFDEFELSALSEVGNILASSYINSISSLTGLNIKVSIPSISIDMAAAILSVPAVEFGKIGDKALFIETEIEENDKQIKGDLFLVPEVKSFSKILKSLGVSE